MSFSWKHKEITELLTLLDRKQCIYIGHDWGATIGWEFLSKYQYLVQKYVLMSAPSSKHFIFFQMPALPELTFSANDLAIFFRLWHNEFNDNFTEEDLEAYKYVFSQEGLRFILF